MFGPWIIPAREATKSEGDGHGHSVYICARGGSSHLIKIRLYPWLQVEEVGFFSLKQGFNQFSKWDELSNTN